jgi:3-methyladenine DNA glycosylase Tag
MEEPAPDDRPHFAFLMLEAAQAGLNWSLVLNKRKGLTSRVQRLQSREGRAILGGCSQKRK